MEIVGIVFIGIAVFGLGTLIYMWATDDREDYEESLKDWWDDNE